MIKYVWPLGAPLSRVVCVDCPQLVSKKYIIVYFLFRDFYSVKCYKMKRRNMKSKGEINFANYIDTFHALYQWIRLILLDLTE